MPLEEARSLELADKQTAESGLYFVPIILSDVDLNAQRPARSCMYEVTSKTGCRLIDAAHLVHASIVWQ